MAVFRVEPRPGGIAHLVVDDPSRKLNVLTAAALEDLAAALAELEARRNQTNSVPLEPNRSHLVWWLVAVVAILGTGFLGYVLFVSH